jgi:exonuclease III
MLSMNRDQSNRNWSVLCWNVRGINSQEKWDAIRSKILESSCDIVCLQETKKESFDSQLSRNFVLQGWIILNFFHPLAIQEEV